MVDRKRVDAVEELVDDALRTRGHVLFTVTTASMEPAIRQGDQVEVRRLGSRRLAVGDIVLFRDPALGLVVHRVLWRWWPIGALRRVYTKGDAAPRGDRGVGAAAVLGRVARVLREGKEMPMGWLGRRALALRSALGLLAHRGLRRAGMPGPGGRG